MKLIIGLGNPGEKYKNNRHNVGHKVVDELAPQIQNSKFKVVKLQTFMNESGRAVRKLLSNLAIEPSSLYVIHDDLDIRLGEYKIQKGKGPKEHKGVDSVERTLGTQDFWRIRIGVDNRTPENRTPGEEYVLQDFTGEERKIVDEVIGKIVEDLKSQLEDRGRRTEDRV